MKIKTKLCVIAAALFGAGIVLFIVGMSMLGWNFMRLDTTQYTAKSYNSANTQTIERVDISLVTFPIDIKNGEEIALEYFEASDALVTVEQADGVFRIVEKRKFDPFVTGIFSSIGRGEHRFVLTVPHGVDIEASGKDSDVTLSGVQARSVKIVTTNLKARLNNVTVAEELFIRATNADVKLENVEAGESVFTATNLDLRMESSSTGNATIKGTNTDIDISRSTFDELAVTGVNLDMDCLQVIVKQCTVKGTNASISTERLTVDKLSVKSVNLDAELEIVGIKSEYTVVADGDDMPKDQDGTTDKLITLDGVNNDVELVFVSK